MYTEKIRIYPNRSQRDLIDRILYRCKELYNYLLERHLDHYKSTKKTLGKFDYNHLSKEFPSMNGIHSQVIQSTGARLADAFQRFFKKQNRFPKYKSLRNFKSFTYPQATGFELLFSQKRIRLGKFGKVKSKFSRPVFGVPKTCTIKKFPSGRYYAFVIIDDTDVTRRLPVRMNNSIGIDLGMSRFFTDQSGNFVSSPRHLKRNLRRLQDAQRELSRKNSGSKNREKQRIKVAKLHEKVHNCRRDFHFKVAHWLVNNYSQVVCEDLSVRSMFTRKHEKNQRRSLCDQGLSEFLVILEWMSKKYSCSLEKVNPHGTSQICSQCGTVVKKDLSERTHSCPSCGLILDRDINAARNILSRKSKNIPVGTTGASIDAMLVEIKIPGLCS